MTIKRKKGIAIVQTSKGLLLVAGRNKVFSFAGGAANRGETRQQATIRELYEETGLKTRNIKYLFSYIGDIWHNSRGQEVRNYTKVFLIWVEGTPRPQNEIKYIDYYKKDSTLMITEGTKRIIEKLKEYK